MFATGASASSASTGTALTFNLPAANGTYTLRLFFADPNANANNQTLFNIVANGTTLVSNYDTFKAAGGKNIAVELDLTVTVTGGKGLTLSLVSAGGYYARLRQRHRARPPGHRRRRRTNREHPGLHQQRPDLVADRQRRADQPLRRGPVHLDRRPHHHRRHRTDPRHLRHPGRHLAAVTAGRTAAPASTSTTRR